MLLILQKNRQLMAQMLIFISTTKEQISSLCSPKMPTVHIKSAQRFQAASRQLRLQAQLQEAAVTFSNGKLTA